MTRITRNLVESFAVLAAGLAIIGLLMFAFAYGAEARSKDGVRDLPKLEVAISDSGRVIVRGAEVTARSGQLVVAKTDWGGTELSWTIRTDAGTAVVRADGSGADLDDLRTGHTISFSGNLDGSAASLSVAADVVRDWSLPGDRSVKDHAKSKAEARADWHSWFKRMPVFSWFGDTDSRR